MRMRCLLFPILLALVMPALALAQDAPTEAGSPTSSPSTSSSSPYMAVVPVADTSADKREPAFATALVRVMSQMMGHSLSSAQAKEVSAQAASYVKQYHYQRASSGADQPYELAVTFAPSAIQHLSDNLASINQGDEVNDIAGAPSVAGIATGNEVWISGLHSALDFAGALRALHRGPGVDRVAVRQAQGEGMLVEVHASTGLSTLVSDLENSGRFVSGPTSAGAAMGLRWVR